MSLSFSPLVPAPALRAATSVPTASKRSHPLQRLARGVLPALALVLAFSATRPAWAQSEASAALSLLPVASVAVASGGASVAAGAVAMLPVALLASGAVLTVRAVEASAHGTVYLLERASDGAQASIALGAAAASAAALSVGSVLACSVIASGTLLLAAGEVVAFIPNALGQALLYSERL
ncbi:hypothetical protein SAMN05428957_11187 [Oryzisolibacter propanilivorax]|uniref:Uncharacterized protein n=1 Tax=Oryzisolibacter propanilivorax TaxID=1527607 RepID=A0A1G9V8B9_9BURK|nr:hypothetical protein [Oryzisolibacter propanilivorax]SDM68125.1 hypothetical protein SAMN05428957_11187 [Oryzisolibacter propanilivorax]